MRAQSLAPGIKPRRLIVVTGRGVLRVRARGVGVRAPGKTTVSSCSSSFFPFFSGEIARRRQGEPGGARRGTGGSNIKPLPCAL